MDLTTEKIRPNSFEGLVERLGELCSKSNQMISNLSEFAHKLKGEEVITDGAMVLENTSNSYLDVMDSRIKSIDDNLNTLNDKINFLSNL